MTAKDRIAELRKFIRIASYNHQERLAMLCHVDAIEKELEGEREWGLKHEDGSTFLMGEKAHAESYKEGWRQVKVVSRRKAGPWEEERG